jgi:hypothetical protein
MIMFFLPLLFGSALKWLFLGAFAKLRRAIVSFVMSVRLSVHPSVRLSAWNNSAPTGRIFVKFYI